MGMYLEHIKKVFDHSEQVVLEDIDCQIESGEFVCIVGPSGCGKSTLLNMVAGLEEPTAGRVLINSREVKEPGADRVVMFQEAALFPWLNVLENVKFGLKIAKVSKEEQEEKAMYYLKMVRLTEFKNYSIHQLSGGMKQRVALARALALDSEFLLMDEPFSALDKQTTNMLREEVHSIWEKTKKTVLFVTHSVEEAVFFADKILVLSSNPGRIKCIHQVDLKRPRHIESPGFIELRKQILNEVRSEVEKIAEKEHDKK